MRVAVVIPAAGGSRRYAEGLESPRSKLDEELGGRPVLQRTVELFTKLDRVGWIVVAGPHEESAYAAFCERHGDKLGLLGVKLCRGGATHRWETVKAALEQVPGEATHIAVHDGARPCASEGLIERLFTAAERHGAVVPGVESPDTIKRVGDVVSEEAADPLDAILMGAGKPDTSARRVTETLSREGLMLIQTPQVFEAGLLRRAYGQKDLMSTDDAQLVERLGEEVVVVRGEATNIKITRAGDLSLAGAILGVKGSAAREVHKRF